MTVTNLTDQRAFQLLKSLEHEREIILTKLRSYHCTLSGVGPNSDHLYSKRQITEKVILYIPRAGFGKEEFNDINKLAQRLTRVINILSLPPAHIIAMFDSK